LVLEAATFCHFDTERANARRISSVRQSSRLKIDHPILHVLRR
jgi:hypothetical protein